MTKPLVRSAFREAVRTRREDLGLSPTAAQQEAVADHLRAMLATAELSVRVPLDVLVKILRGGRFKTVYEEGVESKNPDRSMAEEALVWDLDPKRPEEFPIFGYAASWSDMSDPAARAHLHSAYGSARVILCDSMREHTTVFFGDSLSWIRRGDGSPAPIDSPDDLAWPHDRGSPFERLSADEGSMDEYIELQFIGGIARSMIREVLFDFVPRDELKQLLGVHHIPWRINRMPEIPGYLKEVIGSLPSDTLTDLEPQHRIRDKAGALVAAVSGCRRCAAAAVARLRL